MCKSKSWLKVTEVEEVDLKEKVRSSHWCYSVGFPFASVPSQHGCKCEGLSIVPLPAVHLLLHHEDDHPGVEGVVADGDDVKASPGRLDFLTVGE